MMRRKRALFTAIESLEIRRLLSSYLVNTTSDAADPGIGLLSLREAVAAANTDTTPDTISFDPAVFTAGSLHTITLENGPILFTNTTAAINLNGPGSAVVAVDGNQISRVFQISSGATVSISGLTVTHGATNTAAGVLAIGGGILNAGTLTLNDLTVSDNVAIGGNLTDVSNVMAAADAQGGGISNSGFLTISNSDISSNSALGGNSLFDANPSGAGAGGGVYSTGTLIIADSDISGNTVTGGGNTHISYQVDGGDGDGGGIYCSGTLTISDSSVENNSANGGVVLSAGSGSGGNANGGGIDALGLFSLSDTSITKNDATGGDAAGSVDGEGLGGAASGAGVYTGGVSTFTDDEFSNNTGVAGYTSAGGSGEQMKSAAASGGGIFSFSTLQLNACTVSGNQVTGGRGWTNYAGVGDGYGGGITTTGSLTVDRSTIEDNTATSGLGDFGDADFNPPQNGSSYGGGVYSTKSLVISDSTVSGNVARSNQAPASYGSPGGNGEGGGIFSKGTATITYTSVIGNEAQGGPGDIGQQTGYAGDNYGGSGEGGGVLSNGSLTITNSTLSGNQAIGGAGGNGVEADNTPFAYASGGNGGNASGGAIYSGDELTVKDCTISSNTTVGGAAGQGYSTGTSGIVGTGLAAGVAIASGTAIFNNTVIAANIANGSTENDISGSADSSSGYNLIGVGGGLTNGINGNQIGVDNPELAALANNGGPTQTMLPLAGSPVIDAGSNALIPVGVNTDQRGDGYPRILNGRVDIGAVESPGPVSVVPSIIFSPPADQMVVADKDTSFSLGTFAESNATGPFSATVDWGDGSTDTVVSYITASGTIPAQSHTFASIGNDTVTITVTDSAGDASSPQSFAVTVDPAAVSSMPLSSSNTSLTASTVLSASGTQVFLTSAVVGNGSVAPTGTVTFMLNGLVIGTGELSSGIATLRTGVLATGSDVIAASYGGDGNYAASASSPVNVVIPGRSSVLASFSKAVVPSTNVAGQKLNAKLPLVLTNSAAAIKGVFTIAYYVNTTDTLDGKQTLLSTVAKNVSIKSAKNAIVTTVIKSLPSTLPAGRYYLLARVVDPAGLICVAATSSTFKVVSPVVQLSASAGAVSPIAILVGRSGSIIVTITNTGNITASGVLGIAIEPTADRVTPISQPLATSSKKIAIAAGKHLATKLRVKVPTTLAEGDYFPYVTITFGQTVLTAIGSSEFEAG